jgi:hypothetical protein
MLTSIDEKRLKARLAELEASLKRQQELTKAEQMRANRLEEQMRDGWKVAALSRPQRQRPS